MDGFGLALAIRGNPALAGLRLLMLTSAAEVGMTPETDALGISNRLCKPVRKERLQAAVLEALGSQRGERPLAPGGRSAPGAAQEGAAGPGEAAGGNVWRPRVLVAEDNLVNQKVATRMLERLGCRVEVRANGKEVLEALGGSDYDLVLMDCQMPEMDGFEATRAIRQAEGAQQRHTPIVAMTASAMAEDRERCLEAGMDGYVSKPMKLEDLRAAVDPWIARARGAKAPL
jgi:CheY-like chemotaxis protein